MKKKKIASLILLYFAKQLLFVGMIIGVICYWYCPKTFEGYHIKLDYPRLLEVYPEIIDSNDGSGLYWGAQGITLHDNLYDGESMLVASIFAVAQENMKPEYFQEYFDQRYSDNDVVALETQVIYDPNGTKYYREYEIDFGYTTQKLCVQMQELGNDSYLIAFMVVDEPYFIYEHWAKTILNSLEYSTVESAELIEHKLDENTFSVDHYVAMFLEYVEEQAN